jgi:streptogrisin C
MRRRLKGLATSLVVVVGVFASTAAGSAEPAGRSESGGTGEVEIAVADLAADRGISVAEAQRRIGWQRRAADFTNDVRKVLSAGFGGVWIAPDDGDRVKVGLVAGAADRGAVRSAQATAELSDAVDTVEVRYPYAHLEMINGWLRDQLVAVNAGAAWPLAAGLRPDRNQVRLALPQNGVLTDAQRGVVDTARQRFGEAVYLDTYSAKPRTAACDYPVCDAPLRAGIAIVAASSGPCTGGFLARSRSDGRLYQFTAGHCAARDRNNWVTTFTDGTVHTIGPVHNHRWSTVGDMAILRVNNPAGWDPRAWVFVTASEDTTRDETYHISADNFSTLGQRVCTTGAALGHSDCGTVTELDVTFTAEGVTVGGLGRANFCAIGGDSGAPVYASHTAYGIVSARDGECNSLYQGIREAEDLMNVNVAHGSS